MYAFFAELLSDKKSGTIFQCFGPAHLAFVFLFTGLAACLYFGIRHRRADTIKKTVSGVLNWAVGLYIADIFLMPLAYGEIDVEKLPFHVCTAMCVACFLSRHTRFFGKYKLQFATLGFVSNLVYLIYPAGVMWHGVHPQSYRVVQTLSFHGIMMVYGFLVLCFEKDGFSWKRIYRDGAVIIGMTAWAILGNLLYNSEARTYNWFFVVQDPFGMFPQSVAPFVMPIVNIVLFFVVEILVYLFFMGLRKRAENSAIIC